MIARVWLPILIRVSRVFIFYHVLFHRFVWLSFRTQAACLIYMANFKFPRRQSDVTCTSSFSKKTQTHAHLVIAFTENYRGTITPFPSPLLPFGATKEITLESERMHRAHPARSKVIQSSGRSGWRPADFARTTGVPRTPTHAKERDAYVSTTRATTP